MTRFITTEIDLSQQSGPPQAGAEAAPVPLPSKIPHRMIGASIIAYHVVNQHNYFFPAKYWDPVLSTGHVTLITADSSPTLPAVDAAFVTTTTDGWAVLSIRGTEPPSTVDSWETFKRCYDDWRQDSYSARVPFHINGVNYGQVHQGFHTAFEAMKAEVYHALAKLNWSSLNGLQVTGHSKGASLCFYFALWARHCGLGIKTIEVNAFAPTAVGDSYFTAQYKAAKIPTMRHMRHWDCVPYLLPFYAASGSYYDFYHFMHFGLNLTEDIFHALKHHITGGYSAVGDVAYYNNPDPHHSVKVDGDTGLNDGYWDLINGIKHHAGFAIPESHSAINSYYPAVMRN